MTKTGRWARAAGGVPAFRVATTESVPPKVWVPSVPDRVRLVGCAVTDTLAVAPDGALAPSPAKLAVTGYEPGVSAARSVTLAVPLASVIAGSSEDPIPIRISLPASGVPPDERFAATVKLLP